MPVTSPPATIISEARLGSVVMPPLPSYHPTKKGRGLGTATSMTYDPNDPGATWNQKSPSGPVNVLEFVQPSNSEQVNHLKRVPLCVGDYSPDGVHVGRDQNLENFEGCFGYFLVPPIYLDPVPPHRRLVI